MLGHPEVGSLRQLDYAHSLKVVGSRLIGKLTDPLLAPGGFTYGFCNLNYALNPVFRSINPQYPTPITKARRARRFALEESIPRAYHRRKS